MRWPWVTRSLYDTCQGIANRLLHERDTAQAEVRRLTDLALTMKRQGYEPLPPPPPPPFELAPEVLTAIEQRSMDSDSERTLRRVAERLARTGTEDAQIATLILNGESLDDL